MVPRPVKYAETLRKTTGLMTPTSPSEPCRAAPAMPRRSVARSPRGLDGAVRDARTPCACTAAVRAARSDDGKILAPVDRALKRLQPGSIVWDPPRAGGPTIGVAHTRSTTPSASRRPAGWRRDSRERPRWPAAFETPTASTRRSPLATTAERRLQRSGKCGGSGFAPPKAIAVSATCS